ncbi:MAG: permease [Verrucomicrobiota bacterium]
MDGTALKDISYAFLSILFEGAPFIFVGTLVSGFIDAYLPSGKIEQWLPKKKPVAIMACGLLGAVLPVCECAIVPVIRRLIQKGLPISCAVTYMLSAPIINPIVVLSTWRAFSRWEEAGQNQALFVSCSRLIIAYIVTVSVGMLIMRFTPDRILKPSVLKSLARRGGTAHEHEHEHEHEDGHGHGHDHEHEHEHEHGHEHEHEHEHGHGGADETPESERKLVLAMRSSMRDFLDTAMYFTIGVLITAVFNTQVNQAALGVFASNELLGVAAMMAMAFVLSLCSTSDAFIAATFATREVFGLAARLAFMVYGPMMDVKLIFMYSMVFRKRFVFALAVGLFIVIGLLCTIWVRAAFPGG